MEIQQCYIGFDGDVAVQLGCMAFWNGCISVQYSYIVVHHGYYAFQQIVYRRYILTAHIVL